jgi:protein TonB
MGGMMMVLDVTNESNFAQKIGVLVLVLVIHVFAIYWATHQNAVAIIKPKTSTMQAVVIMPVALPLKAPTPKPEKRPLVIQPKVQPIVQKTSVLPPSPKAISVDKPVLQEKHQPVVEEKVTELAVSEAPVAAKTEPAPPTEFIPPRSDAAHLNNPAPNYPPMSRRLGEQGRVVLEVYILANGTVGEVKIKQSSGFSRLDEAALQAVKKWRYQAARRGQQAIDFWYVQPLSFSLNS